MQIAIILVQKLIPVMVIPYIYEGNCFKSYTQTPYSLAERNICVSVCNTTEGFKFKKKLKMEMLLIAKNIVIIMNMLVEIIV
jgi:hypothetical protein